MEFIPFHSRYQYLGAKETRSLIVVKNDLGVPPGEYGLIEYYCIDDTCDCRKVMLHVVESIPPHKTVATIGYGWESAEFYTKWMHGDKEAGKRLTGAYLEVWGTQAPYAEQLMELVLEFALTEEYVERIKKHYRMFKNYNPKRKKRIVRHFTEI